MTNQSNGWSWRAIGSRYFSSGAEVNNAWNFISASAMVTLFAWTNYLHLGLLMTHSWVTVGHDKRLVLPCQWGDKHTKRCDAQRGSNVICLTLQDLPQGALLTSCHGDRPSGYHWAREIRHSLQTWLRTDCSTFYPSAWSFFDSNLFKNSLLRTHGRQWTPERRIKIRAFCVNLLFCKTVRANMLWYPKHR